MTPNSNSAATSARGPVATEKAMDIDEGADYTVALLRHTANLLRRSDFLLRETDRFRLNAITNYEIVDEERYEVGLKLAAAERRIKALESANKDSGLEARLTELAPKLKEVSEEADYIGDQFVLKVEYSANHRISAALYERTTLLLAKVGALGIDAKLIADALSKADEATG